jgi:hypothetical protein
MGTNVAELTTLLAKKDAKIKELEVWRTLYKAESQKRL